MYNVYQDSINYKKSHKKPFGIGDRVIINANSPFLHGLHGQIGSVFPYDYYGVVVSVGAERYMIKGSELLHENFEP